jgi:glycerol-3-phosphate dehydrogenase
MNRADSLARLSAAEEGWDVLVIGGGATGLGIAVDAASRGYRTALLEQHDFAKGTSSRSTKLVHGGVRYLRNGQLGLVRGALRERGLMERNAPHLVTRQAFVIPSYRAGDTLLYGAGLKCYEWLSGGLSFGASRVISAGETTRLLPGLQTQGLRGGVVYYDGQFDDGRMAIALARTATDLGAALLNYAPVDEFLKENGRIGGVLARDLETGATLRIRARVVVNATGVFSDAVRKRDDPSATAQLTVSSGVHLVLPRAIFAGEHALMIPRTSDGRVLFAVPWRDRILIGTTDERRDTAELEPQPLRSEIAFLLEQASRYLRTPLRSEDVLSAFAGLRPLVKRGAGRATSALSRDHQITIATSGLVSVTGGKWTTYRKMAEETVDRAAAVGGLARVPSRTRMLPLQGSKPGALAELKAGSVRLHERLSDTEAGVVDAVRFEMARTVEDVLARRTRALFLDARAAQAIAPRVAQIMARELGRSAAWEAEQVKAFSVLAAGYLLDT